MGMLRLCVGVGVFWQPGQTQKMHWEKENGRGPDEGFGFRVSHVWGKNREEFWLRLRLWAGHSYICISMMWCLTTWRKSSRSQKLPPHGPFEPTHLLLPSSQSCPLFFLCSLIASSCFTFDFSLFSSSSATIYLLCRLLYWFDTYNQCSHAKLLRSRKGKVRYRILYSDTISATLMSSPTELFKKNNNKKTLYHSLFK